MPVKEKFAQNSTEHNLLAGTINSLKCAKYIKTIYLVLSDASLAETLGVVWIDRDSIPNVNMLGTDELLQKSLEIIESRGDFPESLLYVNYDYLHRPDNVFDELIMDAQFKGYDTVFPGFVDYGHYWLKNEYSEYTQSDASMKGRSERQPIFRALYGLGCVTSVVLVRSGKLVGGKVGILPIKDLRYTLRLRDLGMQSSLKI